MESVNKKMKKSALMRSGNLLKSHICEICVKWIRVNQGVGVVYFLVYSYTDLVSLLLALIANRMIAQMATHMINVIIGVIIWFTVTQKR